MSAHNMDKRRLVREGFINRIISEHKKQLAFPIESLSFRELAIEVADKLMISERTAREYMKIARRRIMQNG